MTMKTLSDTSALLQRRKATLGSAYRLFYDEPLHVARAEGVWIYDTEGRRYLDVYNNVPSLGHAHPGVVAALNQAAVLNTHTRYVEAKVVQYAERLLSCFPDELNRVMLTCTGSEANDLALRITRAATGATGVVVTRLAYHGVTAAVAEISPSLGGGVPLGSHVRTVALPDPYREEGVDVGLAFASAVRAAIADLQRHGVRPGALIVDTIFSSDGVLANPPGFLRLAVADFRAAGGLFIADEVQAGFARTGENMWGFERHGLVPDIVSLGKAMGNGYPLAGVVAKAKILDSFAEKGRYFNTLGGNPVASAVGLAVIDALSDPALRRSIREISVLLFDGLRRLSQRSPLLGDVRGAGLFIGVELVCDRISKTPLTLGAARIVNSLRDFGVLASATGPHGNVLKLRPLLVFQPEHIDFFLSRLEKALDIEARRPS